ncbi:Transcription initiation factor TFIIA small subunit [Monocercomonoides exilis]|uniref:Transcription initiation factor TFIIA small subunit n=1 Tax=Monocercomonoides exilis TaxID=2049356 RepID=UPI00355AA0AC|nr:Transcription initiation factor TFIIA small subunit [Monocercomonoides exilis]|eukprot:MONOS_6700.1-p1 / transcript=MONOS_6700.1 / gene=MONOS_6700 / organism=Monocercomonoides_exilis_PA203 / gene_product=Transcription initiation factor TFIIA small subunit / transcript_product=Transcription initiation factor TFIIA small subunit / location=Mono_scaffold00216:13029-13472(+) / protein_length=110 / sequence_SO=supercontig / SO=protein_coding / is_pseudo=false
MSTDYLYRQSTIGRSLIESLSEMIEQGFYSPEEADMILAKYDESIARRIGTGMDVKCAVRGHLHSYQTCDGITTLDVDNGVTFKCGSETVNVGTVKFVCCQAEIPKQNH